MVTQVFAVLLDYLTSPDSSPTVQACSVGGWGAESLLRVGLEGLARGLVRLKAERWGALGRGKQDRSGLFEGSPQET